MSFHRLPILQVYITVSPTRELLENIRNYLRQGRGEPLLIFTPNPEIIMSAARSERLRKIVNSAQINLPDGTGVTWALERSHDLVVPRIAGVDFMMKLCEFAPREGYRVGLIGGNRGVAVKAKECLEQICPGLIVEDIELPIFVAAHTEGENEDSQEAKDTFIHEYAILDRQSGEEKSSRDTVNRLIEKIKKSSIDILFVGLGCPKQEYLIDYIRQDLMKSHYSRKLVMMSVGGSLDYLAGSSHRAPRKIQAIGLEWLYRLIWEPWRIGRQLKGVEFFWRVINKVG